MGPLTATSEQCEVQQCSGGCCGGHYVNHLAHIVHNANTQLTVGAANVEKKFAQNAIGKLQRLSEALDTRHTGEISHKDFLLVSITKLL